MKRSAISASIPSPNAVGAKVRELVASWLIETPSSQRAGFLDRVEAMAAALSLWGSRTNLTANPGDPAEIAFHVIDSWALIAFAPASGRGAIERSLGTSASVLDLGAGAGFPGLVLAAAFDARFTLVESRRKRASYLEVAAHEMGLHNVTVERRRVTPDTVAAEFDLVTGRAFGGLADLYRIAARALRPSGLVLVYASAGQSLEEGSARHAGLAGPVTWEYRVAHGRRLVARTAAMWCGAKAVGASRKFPF